MRAALPFLCYSYPKTHFNTPWIDTYIASTFARIYIRTDVGALGNLSSRWMREAAAEHHTSTVFTHNSIKPKEKKNSKMTEDGVSELLGL